MYGRVIAAMLLLGLASAANAQSIENACLRSDREAKSRALCGCIQDAANLVLSQGDQKVAASFFANPHKAQEMRQSSRRAHEGFWDRYKEYATTASEFCKQ